MAKYNHTNIHTRVALVLDDSATQFILNANAESSVSFIDGEYRCRGQGSLTLARELSQLAVSGIALGMEVISRNY